MSENIISACKNILQIQLKIKEFSIPKTFLECKHAIETFNVREDDIWICTFPRSGTTWMQELIWMLVNNLDFINCQQDLEIRSPYLERQIYFPVSDSRLQHLPDEVVNSVNFVANLKGRRIIKTHLPWQLLPEDIQNNRKTPKIIYVMRNPRDVVVSHYYFVKNLLGYEDTFEEFLNLFLRGEIWCGPYWSHIFSYWNLRTQSNLLIVNYEEMKTNLREVIKKCANFLNIDITTENIITLEKHLSFENMKANEAVNKTRFLNSLKNIGFVKASEGFVRSGLCQQYQTEMPSDMIKRIDDWVLENTQNKNFPFYLEK